MADIELDDLRDHRENQPPGDDREDQEATFDDGWRDESLLDIDPGTSIREGLEAERRADRNLGVGLGVKKRAYTEDKKNLLRELNINVNKGHGPSARSLFKRLKVTVNREGRIH